MRNLIQRNRDIYFAFVATALMLLTGYPIQLFLFVGSSGGENPLEPKPIHIWDFNIKKTKDKEWGYEATTDVYNVKFPTELVDSCILITTEKGNHQIEMKLGDTKCYDYVDRAEIKNANSLESPKKIKPDVDGLKITYPDVYTNISLQYEIGFHQCKETFIVKSMPEKILSDLMFDVELVYNTSALFIYSDGEKIDMKHYDKDTDIELWDKNGKFVYRIPRPVAYDSPDKAWNLKEKKWVNDSSTIDYQKCRYQIMLTGKGMKITYHLPYDYLARNSTRFPVYLDPPISPTSIYESMTYEGWFNNTIKKTDSTGVDYLPGYELQLESSLYVEDGGTLTLNNITLRVKSWCDGGNSINVYNGGALNFVNNSLVTYNDTNCYNYCLNFYQGSSGIIDESTIKHVDDSYNGIYIESDDVIIMDSIIEECDSSAIYICEANPVIFGNEIYGNSSSTSGYGIYVGTQSSPKIYSNTIKYFDYGIFWNGNYWEDEFYGEYALADTLNTEYHDDGIIPSDDDTLDFTFDYNNQGFTTRDDQSYSNMYYDEYFNCVYFHADSRDPKDTHERLERKLPLDLTDVTDWHINTTFSLEDKYYSPTEGISPSVSPVYLSSTNGSQNVYINCYGGDSINNSWWDIIYIKTDNATIATYYTNNSGWCTYNVNISYNTSDGRLYGRICNGYDPSIVYASGNITYGDFSLEDIAVARANGLGTSAYVYFNGNVDDISIYYGEIEYNCVTSTSISLEGNNLWDSIYVEKHTSDDCEFRFDILDGASLEVIPGLSNLSGTTVDIAGINPLIHSSIAIRGHFFGNMSSSSYINSWTGYFRAVDKHEWNRDESEGAILAATEMHDDYVGLTSTGFASDVNKEDFDGNELEEMWEEIYHGGASTSEVDVVDSNLVPYSYGIGTGWHGPGVKTNLTEANGTFVLEATMDIWAAAYAMGFFSIELLNGTNVTIYEFNWSDSNEVAYTSKIDFNDTGGNLYSSGTGTEFNDFAGRIKIERKYNNEISFHIDKGNGY